MMLLVEWSQQVVDGKIQLNTLKQTGSNGGNWLLESLTESWRWQENSIQVLRGLGEDFYPQIDFYPQVKMTKLEEKPLKFDYSSAVKSEFV